MQQIQPNISQKQIFFRQFSYGSSVWEIHNKKREKLARANKAAE